MALGSKRTLGLYSTGGCAVIAAVCVLLNLVSFRYFFRIDCTEYSIYSLSDATHKILRSLPDPLRIRIFFEENLPPEYLHQRRYLQELLQEMKTAGGGRLKVEFADMKTPESRQEAERAGIANLRFTAVRKDKFEVQEGMMGLAMYYEDKKEVIPALTQVSNLEYELAGRIIKLTRKIRPVVGWTTGNSEQSPPEPLEQYLSQNFELRRINHLNTHGWRDGSSEYAGLSALMVAGPKSPFSDTGLRAVDEAILNGVPTALLLDLYDVQMGNFFARKVETRLDRLLEGYGVQIREGMVADAQNVPVQIQTQQGFFSFQTIVNFPFIPRITNLSKDHPVTRTLQEIALPFVAALDVRDTTGVTVLASSTEESYRIARPFIVNPTMRIDIEGAEHGPFAVGMAIQGRRRSAFADTPALGVSVRAVRPAPTEGPIRLVVFTNAGFLDESRGSGGSNLAFAANLVDWLAASEDLIAIRSKGQTFRPLEKVSDQKRNLIKASNLFLMPLLVTLIGGVRWQVRRIRRRRWEAGLS